MLSSLKFFCKYLTLPKWQVIFLPSNSNSFADLSNDPYFLLDGHDQKYLENQQYNIKSHSNGVRR